LEFEPIELAVASCELRAQLSELIVVVGARVLKKGLVLRALRRALCDGRLALVVGVFKKTRGATAVDSMDGACARS
jgi:hypothetical protein